MESTRAPLADFERNLEDIVDWTASEAKSLERRNMVFWWIAVLLTGLASVVGFIAEVPPVRSLGIPLGGWVVSSITAAGAGVEALRRTSRWRQLSKVSWALNVEANTILALIRNELGDVPEQERLAKGSQLLREANDRYGVARDTILDQREMVLRPGTS